MDFSNDRRFIGWTTPVIEGWEQDILYLPAWERSVYLPSSVWIAYTQIYKALEESPKTRAQA